MTPHKLKVKSKMKVLNKNCNLSQLKKMSSHAGKIKGSSFPIVKCPECGLSIPSNNLKRHVRNKYSSSQYKSYAVYVDKDLAIDMVLKYRSGLWYPIHAQKLLHGFDNCKIFCVNNVCKDSKRICRKK